LLYPPQVLNKVSLRRIYVELGEVLSLTECKEFSDGVQFVSQVCIIRLLATPKPVNDSREFIGNMVCSFRPKNLSFFERPTRAVGLRFYFPHTSTALYDFNVKIESRITDITKIWLENTGRFLRPIPNDNLSVIHDNLSITREFLVKNVTNFLTQHNAKR